jgi:hypothetical protein
MNKLPAWLKRGILAIHTPSRTVFEPDKLYDQGGNLYLTDPTEQQMWKASECDRLRIEHLSKGGTFASETTIAIYPDPRGLVVSDGLHRKLIQLQPVSDFDDGEEAARSLAWVFNGSVYSEEAV